jgi:ABC-type Mn2+/Zn2+ transport system permease subunit
MTMPSASDLLLPLAMAVAAGLVGSYAVMRRMTLASDAISHVALPGVGIAILLNVNPVLGALAALILGTLLIWAVERQARIPTEAIIGVVFSTRCSGRRAP